MIITGLSAKNVLKYASLELADLPTDGVIAISGPNESGKSSIGETLCFALFGRTFAVGAGEVGKVIRWGEPSCQVRCTFTVGDGAHYELARFLDGDGNHSARLNRLGEEDNPIARGVTAVEEALYDLIGYDFSEFVDSFYLAQREITAPHAHSSTVKAMAGIAPLEYVGDEIVEDTDEDLRAIADTERDIADVERQIQELDLQEGRLATLEDEREALRRRLGEARSRADKLEAAGTGYREGLSELARLSSKRRANRVLAFLAFVIAAIAGAAWVGLARMPDHPLSRSLARALNELPQWSAEQLPVLLYVAAGFALLWLLLLARGVGLKTAAARLAARGRELAEQLDLAHRTPPGEAAPRAAAVELESSPDAEVDTEAVTAAEAGGEPLGTGGTGEVAAGAAGIEQMSEERFAALRDRVAESLAGERESRGLVDAELAVLRRTTALLEEHLAVLDQAVREEQGRLERGRQLDQMTAALREKIAARRERIRTRELAQDLLAGASRHLSQRFNRDLRELVGRTLPLFTDGRYEHLQIDPSLEVRVFSSEKRDYMDLDEISSGTQRQIMLALRLALSQELIDSTALGSQFVFLDEPFAFFDQDRTRTSLRVLPQLSDEIRQAWIVSQEFPPDAEFDLHIRCARDYDRLPSPG